jgi:hypothetical protein
MTMIFNEEKNIRYQISEKRPDPAIFIIDLQETNKKDPDPDTDPDQQQWLYVW